MVLIKMVLCKMDKLLKDKKIKGFYIEVVGCTFFNYQWTVIMILILLRTTISFISGTFPVTPQPVVPATRRNAVGYQ
jgi:hypothetical protein